MLGFWPVWATQLRDTRPNVRYYTTFKVLIPISPYYRFKRRDLETRVKFVVALQHINNFKFYTATRFNHYGSFRSLNF